MEKIPNRSELLEHDFKKLEELGLTQFLKNGMKLPNDNPKINRPGVSLSYPENIEEFQKLNIY